MMTEDRQRQIDAKRAEMIETIRPKAERELNDERYQRFRTTSARRAVVVAWGASVVATVVTSWLGWSITRLVAMVVLVALAFLVRRVVRGMADLPEEFLDERMRSQRNRAYRHAYIGLVVVALIPLVVLTLMVDANRIAFEVESRHLEALLWLVLGVGMALPSVILAMTEDEV